MHLEPTVYRVILKPHRRRRFFGGCVSCGNSVMLWLSKLFRSCRAHRQIRAPSSGTLGGSPFSESKQALQRRMWIVSHRDTLFQCLAPHAGATTGEGRPSMI